jgi:hypothetical protein
MMTPRTWTEKSLRQADKRALELLTILNWSEDGIVDRDDLDETDRRAMHKLVRWGLAEKAGREQYIITLDGCYVIEPEATTALYGPQEELPIATYGN